MLFQINLYNNNLIINYIEKKAINPNSNCFNCQNSAYKTTQKQPIQKIYKKETTLKKNYKSIPVKKENYMIYNEKNQAIINSGVFEILSNLDIKDMKNQELFNILFELGFIVGE